MTLFFAVFIVTYANIFFSVRSSTPHDAPSTHLAAAATLWLAYRMLFYRSDKSEPIASVIRLVPRIIGARSLD